MGISEVGVFVGLLWNPLLSNAQEQSGTPNHWYFLKTIAGTNAKGTLRIWAKWVRFVIFPVLCLLTFGDTALKS